MEMQMITDQQVMGMTMPQYMAHILEENETDKMELAKVKQANTTLKTMVSFGNMARGIAQLKLLERRLAIDERMMTLKEKAFSAKYDKHNNTEECN